MFCNTCPERRYNRVSSLSNSLFPGVWGSALNGNQFEQEVLDEFRQSKNWNSNQFWEEILSKLDSADWKINDKVFKSTSLLCSDCVKGIWNEIIFKYWMEIASQLPSEITQRDDCWYGKDCTTQRKKYQHAAKLNHICESSK